MVSEPMHLIVDDLKGANPLAWIFLADKEKKVFYFIEFITFHTYSKQTEKRLNLYN